MSIVLITGSCGLVGSESVEFFYKKGFEILGIDNNSRKKFFGETASINWKKNELIKKYKYYRHLDLFLILWRKERDSNPRYTFSSVRRFSKPLV